MAYGKKVLDGKEYNYVDEIGKFEIEADKVFHLKNLYKRIFEFLNFEEGFVDPQDGSEKFERLYYEMDIGGGATNHYIWWRMKKCPDDSKYFMYFIKLDYQTLVMKSTEVMHEGRKVKTNKGDVIIRVTTYLVLDYQNLWDKHPILKRMSKRFRLKWYKDKIEYHEDELAKLTSRLRAEIKRYLDMHTAEGTRESQTPKGGI